MPDSLAAFMMTRKPSADRPLLGHTVLLVEDSRFASEAIRLLCLRSGARIRRADSLASARRHLRTYRPSVLIVDLGLPDGSGLDLIAEFQGSPTRVDVILATSGHAALAEDATAAGADGFLEKPITSLAAFQTAVLDGLPLSLRPGGPRAVPGDSVSPDRFAFRDDLEHILDLLADAPEGEMLTYAARFLSGLARSAGDEQLEKAAAGLETGAGSGAGEAARLNAVTRLVAERIRDRAVV